MELPSDVTIVTPVTNTTLVLKGYITGRIKQEIEAIYLSKTKLTAGSKPEDLVVMGDVMKEATNRALQLIVLKVGDVEGDGVLDAVLELPEDDYDFVRAEVEKIQRPLP